MLKPKLEKLNDRQLSAIDHLLSYFNLNGVSCDKVASYGQKVIFYNLVFRPTSSLTILCCTQYGKSLFTALATLIMSCVEGIVVAIVAPSKDKAKIIMRYYIEHLGDNAIFYSQLEKDTRLERLRQEESKERIILRNGGGAYVLSANQKSLSRSFESAMGMGAKVVLLDEAGLITDETESSIFRMIGGQTTKGKSDAFFAKIGNPFYGDMPYTHLKNDWNNPEMKNVYIDYNVALQEGRYTESFIEKALKKPLADVLYRCEFPNADMIDEKGFRTLILAEDIKYIDDEKTFRELIKKEEGDLKLGVDIGGGTDLNVYCLKKGGYAFFESSNKSSDTMTNVDEIIRILDEWKDLIPENIAVDDIGVGRGVSDRLKELGYNINGVAVGETARDSDTFFNLKAELYWEAGEWIRSKGKVLKQKGWEQLNWIKYKTHRGEKKMQIESKEDMKKRTSGKSSDYSDAFALTFYETPFIGII